ncbi:TetR/AcrR family transcriptional regulator, partial [Kibdelosporangium lantanae]
AEVGPRTLYRHFPTRESLIVGFVEVHLAAAVEQLKVQPADTPLPEALYALVESVIATISANAERILTVYAIGDLSPSVNAQFGEIWRAWQNEVATEITRRHGGKSAEMVGQMGAVLCMLAIDTSVRVWAQSGGKANMRRLLNRALEMLRSGEIPIATPPTKG